MTILPTGTLYISLFQFFVMVSICSAKVLSKSSDKPTICIKPNLVTGGNKKIVFELFLYELSMELPHVVHISDL